MKRLYNNILEISTKVTKKELLKQINLLKEIAKKEKEKEQKKAINLYERDLEKSRFRRKINNSKMAIKKAWKNRRTKKELIKKHIKILRGLK
jgi:glutamate mutase epsilon subunit